MSTGPPIALTKRQLERNITAFYAYRLLIGLQFLLPIWVLYLTDKRGFSLEEVTMLDVPFWLALVFLEVPTGVVADRFGRKTSLLCGTLTNTIGIVVFGYASNFLVIVAAYLVWAAAFTFYSGADAAFLFETLKALGREHEYGRIFGRSLAYAAATGIVATLAGPLMASATDIVVPIYATAVATAATFVLVLLVMKEPPRFESEEDRLGYVDSVRTAFHTVWRSPELRTFVPLVACSMAALSSIFIFSQPFLARHDIETGNVGWFLVFSQVAGVVASLLAHRISGRLGWRRSFTLLPLSTIVVLVCLAAFDALWAFPLIPAGWFIVSVQQPLSSDYVNHRVESAHRATVLSFQSLAVSLVLAPLELTLGIVADRQGLPFAFGCGAAFVMFASLPFLFAWLRTDPPGRVVPAAIPVAGGGGQ